MYMCWVLVGVLYLVVACSHLLTSGLRQSDGPSGSSGEGIGELSLRPPSSLLPAGDTLHGERCDQISEGSLEYRDLWRLHEGL